MGQNWARTVGYHGNIIALVTQVVFMFVNFSEKILTGDLYTETTFIAINPALVIANAGVIYAIMRIEENE